MLVQYFPRNLGNVFNKIQQLRTYCGTQAISASPSFDIGYWLDTKNVNEIQENLNARRESVDIKRVHNLINQLSQGTATENKDEIIQMIQHELKKLPNKTHPKVMNYTDSPELIRKFGEKPKFEFNPSLFSTLSKKHNILRTDHLGNLSGSKSYFLMNDLAELEEALILYSTKQLLQENFEIITVPDILPKEIIEGCGMDTCGERNQVYKLLPRNLCLSGTSEMALAGYFAGTTTHEKYLPLKLAAVSRCYRAETSGLQEEKGIYRVHQFTKVEMFSVCNPSQSEEVLEYFRDLQTRMFEKLGFHFVVLDMPPCELGSPAYRKYDIEAWMPGRNMYGEISSCSNCTDYQSMRLDIKIKNNNNDVNYAHTVNGTACAIPRLLITLVENFQNHDGTISIPSELQSYMNGQQVIQKRKVLPELKLVKTIPSEIL